jgi:hypothetical protein
MPFPDSSGEYSRANLVISLSYFNPLRHPPTGLFPPIDHSTFVSESFLFVWGLITADSSFDIQRLIAVDFSFTD